jgi:mono/diheme cytochrome c family protein
MRKSTIRSATFLFRSLAVAIALAVPHVGAAAGDAMDGATGIIAANLDHGKKLYETACDACHTANVHWRDKRLVDSWSALLHQVDRWQRNAGQRWEAADIKDVAAYLNERFYHVSCPANECAAKAAALHSRDRTR